MESRNVEVSKISNQVGGKVHVARNQVLMVRKVGKSVITIWGSRHWRQWRQKNGANGDPMAPMVMDVMAPI